MTTSAMPYRFRLAIAIGLAAAFPLGSRAASCPLVDPRPLAGAAVTASDVNLRTLACVDGDVAAVLPANTPLTLTGAAGRWDSVVTADGQTGWVAGWLLQAAPATVAATTAAVPSRLDVAALNRYWLAKINDLRQVRGLRLLQQDQRLVETAAKWSAVMAGRGAASHVRSNGQTMNQWATAQGLPFTRRNSPGGWRTNYFTENIAWRYTGDSQASAERALDAALAAYLAEGSGGAHYRTIYHPDWNAVGAGFAFVPQGKQFKMYMTFHYASLSPAP